jgi:hypothetical protein
MVWRIDPHVDWRASTPPRRILVYKQDWNAMTLYEVDVKQWTNVCLWGVDDRKWGEWNSWIGQQWISALFRRWLP